MLDDVVNRPGPPRRATKTSSAGVMIGWPNWDGVRPVFRWRADTRVLPACGKLRRLEAIHLYRTEREHKYTQNLNTADSFSDGGSDASGVVSKC